MLLHSDCYDPSPGGSATGGQCGEPVDSPPLIILHGLFGAGINWRSVARSLSAHRRVYTFDLPNHGYSYHTDSLDYPSMAKEVARSCGELGIDHAVFIGHSMGGKCAMRLALDYPGMIESLVVVDIGPGESPGELAPLVNALTALDLSSLSTRGDADRGLTEKIPDRKIRTFLLQNLRRDEEGKFRWRINLSLIAASLETVHGPVLTDDEMEKLQDRKESSEGLPSGGGKSKEAGPFHPGLQDLPVLFISGADSPYVDRVQQDLAWSIFPSASFHTIPNAGHWLHVDQPHLFLAELISFLF